jgi:hypothetical protein
MSSAFFIIGFCIFSLYVYFLMWNIFYSSKKQREEGNGTQRYYERHQPDSLDTDGMGNYGRFPNKPVKRSKAPKRKTGSQSRMKNYSRKFKEDV